MDIDRLTYEERGDLMKKGLCFRCKKPGHVSRECPQKNETNQNRFQGLKKTGNTAYAMICTLYNKLDEENQAVCMQKLEDEGF